MKIKIKVEVEVPDEEDCALCESEYSDEDYNSVCGAYNLPVRTGRPCQPCIEARRQAKGEA